MFLNPTHIHVKHLYESLDEVSSISLDKIENLVFSGGGIRGLAYAGVARYLEEKKDADGRPYTDRIKRFAGASAGAINTLLLAIGMDVEEMEQEMRSLDLASFLRGKDTDVLKLREHVTHLIEFDDWNVLEYAEDILYAGKAIKVGYEHYGECDGENFTAWLEKMLGKSKKYGGDINKETNFEDFYKITGKELHFMICDSSYSKTIVANHINTPKMLLKDAVRASMAIPLVYTPFQQVYIDGGFMYNYPIEVFDNETGDPEKTLGFILASSSSVLFPKPNIPKDFWGHVGNLLNCLLNTSYEYCFRLGNQYRTVFIECGELGILDFDLKPDQKNMLVANGESAIAAYFAEVYGPDNDLPADRKNAFAVVVPPDCYAEISFDFKEGSDVSIIIYNNIYDGDATRQCTRTLGYDDTWTSPWNMGPNAVVYMITGWSEGDDGAWEQNKGEVRYLPGNKMRVCFWKGEECGVCDNSAAYVRIRKEP